MAKIIGNTTATPNPRPDWNQTDSTKADFIKNKPTVDQTYSDTSANAQSGKAVAEAIAGMVDAAPEALDTLNELAAALGDDPNFATTVLTEIGKMPGEKTENGGVIFNDENNKAIAANSMVSGTNTQAGGKAFEIVNVIVNNDNTTLELQVSGEGLQELEKLEQYIVSNYSDEMEAGHFPVTIIALQSTTAPSRSWGNLDYCGNLLAIILSDNEVDNKIIISNTFKSGQEPWASEEQPATLLIPDFSEFGNITVGVAANASGYDTKAIGAVANAEGYNNIAAGKYSHVEGRDNIAGGYSSHATGWKNKALGQASFVGGKNNIVRNTGHRSAAFGEGQDIKWEDNFYVGRYGNNVNPRPFAVGIGTSDSDRRNGLEVTREGMVIIGKAGSSGQYNSVPQMWQLDEKAPLKNPAFTGTPTAPTPEKNDSSTKIATTEFVKSALGDVDLTNYVTNTSLSEKLTPYIRRGTTVTQNDGTSKTYNGVLFSNYNGEKNGRGPQGERSMVNGDHCNTTKDAINSVAFGNWSSANYANSFALGKGVSTKNASQTVVGTYNADETDTSNPSLFAVGNGTGSAWDKKSTAFNVRTDGSADVQTMGTKDNSVATKKYVDDAAIEIVEWPEIGIDMSYSSFTPDVVYIVNGSYNGDASGMPYFTMGGKGFNLHIWGVNYPYGIPKGSKCLIHANDNGSYRVTCWLNIQQKANISYVDTQIEKVENAISTASDTKLNIKSTLSSYIDVTDVSYDASYMPKHESGIYSIDSVIWDDTHNGGCYALHFPEAEFTLYDKISQQGKPVFSTGMRLNLKFVNEYTNEEGSGPPQILTEVNVVLDTADYIAIRSSITKSNADTAQYEARIAELETQLGQIQTALDEIINIQNTLIGGEN